MKWFWCVALFLSCVCEVSWAKPDKHLRLSVEDLLDRRDGLVDLWPGYWPQDQGFVLYDGSGIAVVVTKRCSDIGLVRFDDYDGMDLCEYQIPASAGAPRFVQLFSLGGQVLPGARQLYQNDRSNALHNLFWQRALQLRDSWTIASPQVPAALGELNADMIANMHIEKELLIRALAYSRPKQGEQGIFRFLAARIERNKQLSAGQVRYQNQMEWREAFITWVSYRALSEVENYSLERLAALYASVLKVPPNRYLELNYVFSTAIYRLTGAVMLELMQRQKIDLYAPYQAGFSPYEILAYAYDTSTLSSAALLAEIAPPDYREAILLKAEQALEGRRDVASLAAEFEARGRYHLLFLETGVRNVEYDPFFHYVLPDNTNLYRRSLRTLIDAPSYSAEIEGGWQRMRDEIAGYLGGPVEMPVDNMPDLSACQSVSDSEKVCAVGTMIMGEGFKLMVRTAIKVTLQERLVLIAPLVASPKHAVGLYTEAGRP